MSQGVDSRRKYILEKATEGASPLCSPKSIYVLATLVGFCWFEPKIQYSIRGMGLTLYRWKLNIQPLRELALKDIESKLSEDNIVEEFFSRVIAK